MGRIDKHYERLNFSALKPLTAISLENAPKNPQSISINLSPNICDEYRFVVSLPTSPLYQAAIAHVKLSSPTIGQDLETLPQTLKKHNGEVDSVEKLIIVQLAEALSQRRLDYADIPQSFFNMITVLSSFWKNEYIKHLKPISRFMSHDFLLNKLLKEFSERWTREDDGAVMRLGIYTVWQGSNADEKEKVVEAIKSVAVDPIILEKLDLLETAKLHLAAKVSGIVKQVGGISKAIEDYSYDGRADCCYVNVPWLVRHLI